MSVVTAELTYKEALKLVVDAALKMVTFAVIKA